MTERQLADRIGNIDENLLDTKMPDLKKRGLWRRAAALAAALAVVIGLAALALNRRGIGMTPGPSLLTGATDLMAGYVSSYEPDPENPAPEGGDAVADLGLRLLRECGEGNALISPLSITSALGMTALGAGGETFEQMSAVLGMEPEALAKYLRSYREAVAGDEVSMANSVWLRDDPGLRIEPDFLQKNADYYSAGAFKAPFDGSTVKDINSWTSRHTHGMIGDVLDEIPDAAVMYLINALSFEAKWEHPYTLNTQIRDADFTAQSGQTRRVKMMYDDIELYFSDERAQGFLKKYEGGFAFAAILPEEGVSVDEYMSGLTGEGLRSLLLSADCANGATGLPKFSLECDYELSRALSSLGMPSAFDPINADLAGIGRGREDTNLYISRVLHNTFIEVGEEGTRAGAVTVAELGDGSAAAPPADHKTVILDRPFIYAIVDTDTCTPIFLGAIRDIGE